MVSYQSMRLVPAINLHTLERCQICDEPTVNSARKLSRGELEEEHGVEADTHLYWLLRSHCRSAQHGTRIGVHWHGHMRVAKGHLQ